jgi:hypothetical protein
MKRFLLRCLAFLTLHVLFFAAIIAVAAFV